MVYSAVYSALAGECDSQSLWVGDQLELWKSQTDIFYGDGTHGNRQGVRGVVQAITGIMKREKMDAGISLLSLVRIK
jgi:hypothetical protein